MVGLGGTQAGSGLPRFFGNAHPLGGVPSLVDRIAAGNTPPSKNAYIYFATVHYQSIDKEYLHFDACKVLVAIHANITNPLVALKCSAIEVGHYGGVEPPNLRDGTNSLI